MCLLDMSLQRSPWTRPVVQAVGTFRGKWLTLKPIVSEYTTASKPKGESVKKNGGKSGERTQIWTRLLFIRLSDSSVLFECFFTFSFMVLWFFFVFFRNCFRLPEDMYSVIKITWRRGTQCGYSVNSSTQHPPSYKYAAHAELSDPTALRHGGSDSDVTSVYAGPLEKNLRF